jgi:ABC-2 type transport system permease protein
MACYLWRGFLAGARHSYHGPDALSGLPGPGRTCAERALHRHLLRHCGIWERDLGIVHKLLVSPAPRVALVLGKALSGGVRGLSQGVAVYLLAWLLGVRINWQPAALAGVALAILLGAATFSTFSLIIAWIVRTREPFMGIGQVLTMPLFFASNAVYPISVMPEWLKVVAHINPLIYEVDAMRGLMLRGGSSIFGLSVDFAVLMVATLVLAGVASRMYPNLAR